MYFFIFVVNIEMKNENFPCGEATLCNGKVIPISVIGTKICGPSNKMLQCVSTPQGGNWNDIGEKCSLVAPGVCPAKCESLTLCDGSIVSGDSGDMLCGQGEYNYLCGSDGKWEKTSMGCQCMNLCRGVRACGGDSGDQIIGKVICGTDGNEYKCTPGETGGRPVRAGWTPSGKCVCDETLPTNPESVHLLYFIMFVVLIVVAFAVRSFISGNKTKVAITVKN
jgi:hypothetical protein